MKFSIGFLYLIFCLNVERISAQSSYNMDVTNVKTDVLRGHLDLGGRNIKGDTIGVNSFYLEYNGKPFVGVLSITQKFGLSGGCILLNHGLVSIQPKDAIHKRLSSSAPTK